MTTRIRDTSKTLGRIKDTSPTLPRLDPALVAAALGAEPGAVKWSLRLGPITRLAVRQELVRRLQSESNRQEPAGAARTQAPLSKEQWMQLENLAASLSGPGFSPSPAQVADALMTLALGAVEVTETKTAKRRRA